MYINTKKIILTIGVIFLYSCVNEIKLANKAISENWKIEKNKDISGVLLRPLTVHPRNYGMFVCKDSELVSDSIRRLYDSEFNGYVAAALESYSADETHIQIIIVAIGYVEKNRSDLNLVPLADVTFTDDLYGDVTDEWYFCGITHPDLVE